MLILKIAYRIVSQTKKSDWLFFELVKTKICFLRYCEILEIWLAQNVNFYGVHWQVMKNYSLHGISRNSYYSWCNLTQNMEFPEASLPADAILRNSCYSQKLRSQLMQYYAILDISQNETCKRLKYCFFDRHRHYGGGKGHLVSHSSLILWKYTESFPYMI